MKLIRLKHYYGLHWMRLASVVVFLLVGGALYRASAAENEASFSQYLAQWLAEPELHFNGVKINPEVMRQFYASQQYQAFWADRDGLTKRAKKALDVIASADDEGINGDLYAVHTIRRIAALNHGDEATRLRVRMSLEVLMSQAVIDYASHMQGGSVRPQWKTGATAVADAAQVDLLRRATAPRDTASYLVALAPQTAEYIALKAALLNYQALAAKGGWPEFPVGKPIKPDTSDARVVTVARILTLMGDLAVTQAEPSALYQGEIVTAVKHFQERHGLEADGVIGRTTQEALAVPVGKRLDQIAASMERMRWMPHDLGSRYVLVNVPGYRLRAVDGDRTLAMNVIVGKPATKTPMFSKEITNVVLNPSWGVPARIAVNEMLPKLKNDPDYLVRGGYTVSENGQVVNPQDIDWESVERGNFTYAFKQQPGDGNALGKVKFTIPDSDNIYLHDTSQRKLFVRSERSLSHGCVRLADPEAMTKFMLVGEGWSEKSVEAAYASAASRTVNITPMPVHLVYWTSWADESGKLHFARDIYGMDKPLMQAMAPSVPLKGTATKLAMK